MTLKRTTHGIALLVATLTVFPFAAEGLSRAYNTPGTYSFTVPQYSTMTVEVWGAGGGGNHAQSISVPGSGGDGNASGWNAGALNASGGGGATGNAGGVAGNGTGGTTNLSGTAGSMYAGGNGANGGSGAGEQPNTTVCSPVRDGMAPGGGGAGACLMLDQGYSGGNGGGGGGYASRTYAPGAFAPGSSVSVTVGAGGQGQVMTHTPPQQPPGNGAPGRVVITWENTATPAPSCTITLSPSSIDSDGESTLSWSSQNADTFFIQNVGYVTGSGSARVSPSQTTTYSGTVENAGGTGNCSGTLTVGGEPDACINSCPRGYSRQGNTCVLTSCPAGYVIQNNACVLAQCIPETGCVAGTFCRNNELWVRDALCAESFVSECSFACSAGACIPEPEPTGDIRATPTIVRRGATSVVTWESSGMRADSCTVRASRGGDAWSGNQGSEVTSAISAETTYTLSCRRPNGTLFQDTVIIRILPVFEEV